MRVVQQPKQISFHDMAAVEAAVEGEYFISQSKKETDCQKTGTAVDGYLLRFLHPVTELNFVLDIVQTTPLPFIFLRWRSD